MPGDLDVLRLMALQFFRILNCQHFIVVRHDHHFGTFFDAFPITFAILLELFRRCVLVTSQGICGFWISFVLDSSALRVSYMAFDGSLVRSERAMSKDEQDAKGKTDQDTRARPISNNFLILNIPPRYGRTARIWKRHNPQGNVVLRSGETTSILPAT